ncbi:glycine--tRNA ligase subunit beta [Methylocaldum szegediense]|uniref:Glycine--tRNA ligase beta subunit n=1 Tax=Methylocaldum szegediense TaxID=73780 RepID=A0ABM9I0X7_9GAMM|nr:glycine--tRNA ligase subunit beta [Methylocaldum szegediense]CAI8814836.1 glycine--tRNA ligase subunit beta [Methylocaldum szegediense]
MSETRDLLFELGTEELPPKSLLTLSRALKDNVESGLTKASLRFDAIVPYAAPRRLAVWVKGLATSQPDQTIERRGPALNAAYQPDGSPSKALEGFMRSCGATLEQLTTIETDKGTWVGFRQEVKGGRTEDLVPDILRQALAALPIAKRMRWGTGTAEFVRPVHWVVLLFGGEVIDTEILGVRSGRITYGHRFHHPDGLVLNEPGEYAAKLLNEGFVVADFETRKARIRESAESIASTVNGYAHIDAELLDEVASLVEWPVPVLGRFDARYLSLPPEVLITTMQANQKYFPVKDKEGGLLPYFIAFSNLDSRSPDIVRAGNERVVRPRLSDAEFFWNQDRKHTLESRVPDLAQITFQKTLGSLLDKTERVKKLAVTIAERLDTESAWVERAALLAKADLLSLMVGEFPELQGTMGRYYALAEGEPEEIAAAIEEQYLPKVSGGPLPKTTTGLMLALADKIDTLTGIFSVGLIPTGDKDPYALRRAALGVIRILLEARLDLDLPALLDAALAQFAHDFDAERVHAEVYDFILERLRGYCLERGVRHDEFEAVLAVRPSRLPDFDSRLKAVREFRQLPEAESLSAANKRIRNILRKAEEEIVANVDDHVLTEAEEKRLLETARHAKEDILPLLHERDYTAALCRLARLRETVDAFFDSVMVMTEDANLRRNRLGLLAIVEGLFLNIADISKLQG